jgi:hypothetical protein
MVEARRKATCLEILQFEYPFLDREKAAALLAVKERAIAEMMADIVNFML